MKKMHCVTLLKPTFKVNTICYIMSALETNAFYNVLLCLNLKPMHFIMLGSLNLKPTYFTMLYYICIWSQFILQHYGCIESKCILKYVMHFTILLYMQLIPILSHNLPCCVISVDKSNKFFQIILWWYFRSMSLSTFCCLFLNHFFLQCCAASTFKANVFLLH